jgi:hypothetical protein
MQVQPRDTIPGAGVDRESALDSDQICSSPSMAIGNTESAALFVPSKRMCTSLQGLFYVWQPDANHSGRARLAKRRFRLMQCQGRKRAQSQKVLQSDAAKLRKRIALPPGTGTNARFPLLEDRHPQIPTQLRSARLGFQSPFEFCA